MPLLTFPLLKSLKTFSSEVFIYTTTYHVSAGQI